jgi:hypothetical protein
LNCANAQLRQPRYERLELVRLIGVDLGERFAAHPLGVAQGKRLGAYRKLYQQLWPD